MLSYYGWRLHVINADMILGHVFSARNECFCTAPWLWNDDMPSLNVMEVFCVCRENLGQWEKISRGEMQDIVPKRLCDSDPVKVDNWLAGPPKEYN